MHYVPPTWGALGKFEKLMNKLYFLNISAQPLRTALSPTFPEHHPFIGRETGCKGLTTQIFFALPQILPFERTLASQSPKVSPVTRNSLMRTLDTGHLLRPERTNISATIFAILNCQMSKYNTLMWHIFSFCTLTDM